MQLSKTFLLAGWYIALNEEWIMKDMLTIIISFDIRKSNTVQKETQAILVEKKL